MPDVDILVAALIADHVHHSVCRAWLEETIRRDTCFAVSRHVLASVVRVTTNRRAFPAGPSLVDVFGYCQDLLDQPHCRIVEPGALHWAIFERLCHETSTAGARVTDAWFAALAIEHGCEWVTCDRDFARFPGLRWSTPG